MFSKFNVKQMASVIESLAKEVRGKSYSDKDYILQANKLVKANFKLAFNLVACYAINKISSNSIANEFFDSRPIASRLCRDKRGRFVRVAVR